MTPPITVLLVDDHAVVRQGVRAFLETQADIRVIGEAGGGAEAVEFARVHDPDIALVDLLMPGMDGVETTRQLAVCAPRTRVIVLTSYSEDEHIFPAIRAGALSYILKHVGSQELAQVIRQTAAGASVLHPEVAARVVVELHGRRGAEPNLFRELSDREIEVLRLLADGRNNPEIAALLAISEHTVKSHVGNILAKLQLADRTQAAVYAWRHGLVRRTQT